MQAKPAYPTDASVIASALVAQARRNIAVRRLEDSERQIGEVRLDIDFYSKADRGKAVEDWDFTDASGRHFKGVGARWCVAKYKWTGTEWRRYRRISGPLKFTPALDRCYEECTRLGLKRLGL
jgi:hypothetical protein